MVTNLSASIKQKLLNISRRNGWEFNWLLTRYANERLLYRISQSSYVEHLILKGAFLFIYLGYDEHRPTRDIDFLGYGITEVESVRQMFKDLCMLPVVDDGLFFDPDSIRVAPIQQKQAEHGYRVHLFAYLGNGRIRIQVDIGVGDVVLPAPEQIEFPRLLETLPVAKLSAYPREVTIAEKVSAMIDKGMANSRLKDYYDLWILSQHWSFSGRRLTSAIRHTFKRKEMSIPVRILPLQAEFGQNDEKNKQWEAFAKKNKLIVPPLAEVTSALYEFLFPPLQSVRDGEALNMIWHPGGNWAEKKA